MIYNLRVDKLGEGLFTGFKTGCLMVEDVLSSVVADNTKVFVYVGKNQTVTSSFIFGMLKTLIKEYELPHTIIYFVEDESFNKLSVNYSEFSRALDRL